MRDEQELTPRVHCTARQSEACLIRTGPHREPLPPAPPPPAVLTSLPSQPYLASFPTSTWKPTTLPSPTITLSDPSIPSKALEHVRAGRHKALGDFDEHLEDVKVDWLKNADVVL